MMVFYFWALMMANSIVISGTGLFTPTATISNDELVASFNSHIDQHTQVENPEEHYSSSAFIEKASGIKSRYVIEKAGILNPDAMHPIIAERSNDEISIQAEMAIAAAKQALANANKTAADIQAVIVACSNLQRAYPAIAIEVQEALGINGFAFDMNVACSSATFGISNAKALIESGQAESVLVINPEICSGHLDFTDRDCHFIFGDAATAIVVEKREAATADNLYEIISCKLATKFSNNIRNNRGFLNRTHPETINSRDKLFVQNGRKVFKEVCPMAAAHIEQHLQQEDIASTSINKLWLHQANLSMNQLIAKKVLGRVPSTTEAPVILDEYANTSSAGSIIAFHLHHDDFNSGKIGVICSFGAGYSIGSVVLKAC